MSTPDPTRAQRLRRPLMLGGIAIVAIVSAWVYFTGGRYESTDNAYVRAAQTSISADISARVIAVEVRENQEVHKGDVLFRLDDQPFRIAVDAARARLATAKLEVAALKAVYKQKRGEIESAQETTRFQQAQYERQKGLVDSGITSLTQVEQVRHALDSARSAVTTSEQDLAGTLATLGGDPDIDPDRHPKVMQAKADLDRAELDLSHATVRAPDDGIVAKVDHLQVGDYLPAATPAFALISTSNVWIEANFKEVQLTHIRPGQQATVELDLYSGRKLQAQVIGVGPGTGSEFSVLPAENATGNWVKVVQRLPVRLEIQPIHDREQAPILLRSGLSAVVTIDTGPHSRFRGGANAADDATGAP